MCVYRSLHVFNFLLDPAEPHARALKFPLSSGAAVAWLPSTSLLMSPEFCICQRGRGQPIRVSWKWGQMLLARPCAPLCGPRALPSMGLPARDYSVTPGS